ncbi:uncharacterized protein LOC143669150 isoform X2 [Tamandua tetradactyla]|uniref:uncharacterized protein LOC143669150 isoform X2 n=1 Tax=Tamandua tetradactyla TaxID=48850 RepID=UPI004053F80C
MAQLTSISQTLPLPAQPTLFHILYLSFRVTSTLISWTEKVAASHPARKKIREERDKFREKECERWIPREWRKRGTISIGSHPLTSALQTWRYVQPGLNCIVAPVILPWELAASPANTLVCSDMEPSYSSLYL